MPQPSILIIEDDPDILELLEYNLKKQRFKVFSAMDGESGIHLTRKQKLDLIILDIMLPGIDGLEVCKQLRRDQSISYIPIIMLTAKSQESDIIVGLELGADDYLTKPFSPQELVARIRAVLRRQDIQTEQQVAPIRIGKVEITPDQYQVTHDGHQVQFTLSEFKLLQAMANKPGKVFTREQLLSFLSDQETYVIDRNIDVHIRAIRKKLKESGKIIQTIRGIGYKCQSPVSAPAMEL
ncbi:MAG: response regulator transcription factor [Oligoflexales bacterium]|nr:response regulator transcription factor [Oligoflexales bacterium]